MTPQLTAKVPISRRTMRGQGRLFVGGEGLGVNGLPALDDALISITCDLRDVNSAGNHVIVTGEVRALEARDGDPSSSTPASTARSPRFAQSPGVHRCI